MRRLAPLLLAGCTSYSGLWDLSRLTIGDESVDDAGFIEMNENGGSVMLWRYRYDAVAAEFIPDPDPTVYSISVDPDQLKGKDGFLQAYLIIDNATGDSAGTTLTVAEDRGQVLVLDDPAFLERGMTWELSR